MTFGRVGVIAGGWGEEREISLKTGAAIAEALCELGHDVVRIAAGPGLEKTVREAAIDVAFLALHGRMGEDGKVQGLLEVMGIPYTGSGVLASALAMNKPFAKRLFRQHNLATPSGYSTSALSVSGLEAVHGDLSFPCIVKPASGGSSVGVSVVNDFPGLEMAIRHACRFGNEALVERFVKGRELTVAILGGEVLGSCEIKNDGTLFDFEAKYSAASGARYHIPPRLSAIRIQNVEAMALSAYRALGCRGAARVDFMLPDVGNEMILEINTIPGMTQSSLVPKIAQRQGLSFHALCERILQLACVDAMEESSTSEVVDVADADASCGF